MPMERAHDIVKRSGDRQCEYPFPTAGAMKVRKIWCNSLLAIAIFWRLSILREGFTEFFRWTPVLLQIHKYYNLPIFKIWTAPKQWIIWMDYTENRRRVDILLHFINLCSEQSLSCLFGWYYSSYEGHSPSCPQPPPPQNKNTHKNNIPSTWLNWDGKWSCRY